MKFFFWISCVLIAYAYFGYAILLSLSVRWRSRPVLRQPVTPTVSIIMAARNEAAGLPVKLQNLAQLDYPRELLQIIIASDGSTDDTASILQSHAGEVVPVILEESGGKANALNHAVRHATSEILVFLDVRQTVASSAVSELVACFADASVGAVSGELLLESADGEPSGDALGIYWKIEKAVRRLESASGSVVGVTGAIYALRRELYTELPIGTILDDVLVPMNVARMGKRVIFQPSAIARDRIFAEKGKEFSRKVRTLTGNYQLLRLAPWLLTPANPILFRFVSHKFLRLMVPLLLIVMFAISATLSSPFYRVVFWMQVVFYLLAVLGTLMPATNRFKPVAIPTTFTMLNVAAGMAFYNFMAGRNKVWVR